MRGEDKPPCAVRNSSSCGHCVSNMRTRLVVGGAEAAADVLVVQHLHLEREVLLQLRARAPGQGEGERRQQQQLCSTGAQAGRAGLEATHVLDDHDEERQLDA